MVRDGGAINQVQLQQPPPTTALGQGGVWQSCKPIQSHPHHHPPLVLRQDPALILALCRVAGVAQARKLRLTKSLDSDENFSPNIRYFVAILRFVPIYALNKAFIEL